jgi:hypothetical protein
VETPGGAREGKRGSGFGQDDQWAEQTRRSETEVGGESDNCLLLNPDLIPTPLL